MNLDSCRVRQLYYDSIEIIRYPNHQLHQNRGVSDHATSKLNTDWSNKQYLQHSRSCIVIYQGTHTAEFQEIAL